MVEYLDIAIGVFMVLLSILTITFISLYAVEKADTKAEDELSETKVQLSEAQVDLTNLTNKCDSDLTSLQNSINFGKSFIMFDQVFRYTVNDDLPEGYEKYEYVSDIHPTLKINVIDSVYDETRTFKQLQLSGLFSGNYVYVNRIIETNQGGGALNFRNPSNVVKSLYSTDWRSALPLDNPQSPSQEELFNQQKNKVEGALSCSIAFEEIPFDWDTTNNGALNSTQNDRVKLARSKNEYILSIPAEYVTYRAQDGGNEDVLISTKNSNGSNSYYKFSINISEIPNRSSQLIKATTNLYIIFRPDYNISNIDRQAYCSSTINDRIRVAAVLAYVWDHTPTNTNDPVNILDITKRTNDWLYPELLSPIAFKQIGYFASYRIDPVPEQPFGRDDDLLVG